MSIVSTLIKSARQDVRATLADNYGFFYSALVAQFGERCAKCGAGGKMQIDHIAPVAQGGASELWNLQLLCAPCNLTKGNRLIDYRAGNELPPPITTINPEQVEPESRRLLDLLDQFDLPIRTRHNVDALRRKAGNIGIYEFAKIAATASRLGLISQNDAAAVRDRARAHFDSTLAPKLREELETARAPKAAQKAAAPTSEAPAPVGGEFTCEACKRAPRRFADFANKWKWKTEAGWRGHKCLGAAVREDAV